MQIRNILYPSNSFSGFLFFLLNLKLHLINNHQSDIKLFNFLQESQSCMEKAKQRASEYLSQQVNKITEVFHLAITSYALSLSSVRSRAVFDSLWKHVRTSMYLLNLYIGIKQSFLCYKWYKLFKTKITKRWVFSTSQ